MVMVSSRVLRSAFVLLLACTMASLAAAASGDEPATDVLGGGLIPVGLAVDTAPVAGSNGNRVFEPGETVTVAPSWMNAEPLAQSFTGQASAFTGPVVAGIPAPYTIADNQAGYGTIASGSTGSCTAAANCYALQVALPSTRPVKHWDTQFDEDLSVAATSTTWTLHLGDSFFDVPRSSAFYRFVETLLHRNVSAGCSTTTDAYCPRQDTTREQMAVFVLLAKEGAAYVPPACTTPRFADVPASSPFCRWIEEVARRGVTTGCTSTLYCPTGPVSREQMAVFVLATHQPGFVPPACGTPRFVDVPASSPFCRWIEELARRGVVTGCTATGYCPRLPVTREQMAVFLTVTFGLQLYP